MWILVSRTNKYIDETRPWELAKNEETEKLESSMYHLIENIRKIGIILLPFMEETAKNLLHQIGITEEFVERYNFDLSNDLGNLLNRTIAMCNKYFGGVVPKYNGCKNDVDKELEEFAKNVTSKFEKTFEEFEISNSLQEIWSLVSRTNKYIDETSPWVLAKEENKEKLEACIYHLIENLRRIAILISPFMESTSEKMFNQLGIANPELKTWESLDNYEKIENTKVIEKGEPLFMRLNAEEEIEFIKNKMKN